MDPNETLQNLIAAAYDGESNEVTQHAGALADWLSRDGFLPVMDKQNLYRLLMIIKAYSRDHATSKRGPLSI